MQQFHLLLRDDLRFCSETACKHSDNTPEVAFTYFFCDFRARLRQRIKHLKMKMLFDLFDI